MACTASGPLLLITLGDLQCLGPARWPSGTTCPDQAVISGAWAAVMCRPVSSMSQAMVYGICRTRRTAEPPIGYRLHLASEIPNFALSPATRMSVPCRISVPPAMAGPSTAAMSGLASRRPLSSPSMRDGS